MTPINLVVASDDSFVKPLAVTIRSVLESLSPGRTVSLHILNGGISPQNRETLSQDWAASGCDSVSWWTCGAESLAGLKVSGHVNAMTYYRMLIPRVLPETVHKAIYLDADLLVRRDLSEIWDQELSGAPCLASQDCAAPYLDSAAAAPNYPRCAPYIVARRPIPNAPALRLEGTLPYFNGGVMVIDVDAWRRENVTQRLIDCLRANREHIRWWDQYALNVVFAGRWRPLDMRWNQGSHLYHYPDCRRSPLDPETFDRLRNDPYIVHFTSPVKPWHDECRHPYRGDWFACLDRTPWKGWRPPASIVRRAYRAAYWGIREQVRLTLRRTQLLLGGSRLR